MIDIVSPKVPLWRSKAVIIAAIFSCLFLVFFYLAVNRESDYMPSQKQTTALQHRMNSSDTQTEAAP